MMKTLLVASLTLAMSASAMASPEVYEIDNSHTFPGFEISHFGFSTQRGSFEKTRGEIHLDREARTGSVSIEVDTGSIHTGFPKREEHLKSADFFNVEKFPTMRFHSEHFVFEGDRLARVDGELTLLGVSKPLSLTVEQFACGKNPMFHKEECGAELSGMVKRSDFGMKTFVPYIGDEVRLHISVEAYKQAPKS